jgi:hypothetical protein
MREKYDLLCQLPKLTEAEFKAWKKTLKEVGVSDEDIEYYVARDASSYVKSGQGRVQEGNWWSWVSNAWFNLTSWYAEIGGIELPV